MIERLTPLLLSFMSRDFGVTVRRVRRNGLLYLLVGLLLLTAYGTGLAGAIIYLADTHGTVVALFALAIGNLAIAIAVLAGVLIANRIERKSEKSSPVGKALLAVTAASLLPTILRSRWLTSAATLGAIGFLASRVGPAQDDVPPGS